MGNNTSNKIANDDYSNNSLLFDRILDAEDQIHIGIVGKNGNETEMQVIRIGDYKNTNNRLLHFTEENNKLKYVFENDIKMVLFKKVGNIHMELFNLNNNKFISKQINPIIVKNYKTISFSSNELDKIYDLFKK